MSAAVNDTTRRFPRTEGEAFRTASWRNPVEGPHYGRALWRDALRWALVVVIALAMAGAMVGAQS